VSPSVGALIGDIQGCCKKTRPKKTTCFFLKSPLKKKIKPTKKNTFYFFFEKIYQEVKNKIGRTLVQLTLTFLIKQNEQQ